MTLKISETYFPTHYQLALNCMETSPYQVITYSHSMIGYSSPTPTPIDLSSSVLPLIPYSPDYPPPSYSKSSKALEGALGATFEGDQEEYISIFKLIF